MRRPTSSGNRLRHPSTWTLRSKLVASTVALFIAITLATGVTTILALNTFLTNQLDAQVTASAGRAAGGDDHDRTLRPNGDTRASRPATACTQPQSDNHECNPRSRLRLSFPIPVHPHCASHHYYGYDFELSITYG